MQQQRSLLKVKLEGFAKLIANKRLKQTAEFHLKNKTDFGKNWNQNFLEIQMFTLERCDEKIMKTKWPSERAVLLEIIKCVEFRVSS